jgi:hypothetical protein
MARPGSDLPPWVAFVVGGILLAAVGWRLIDPAWLSSSMRPRSAQARAAEEMARQQLALDAQPEGRAPIRRPPAAPDVRLAIDTIGSMPAARFAFDPETRARVVTCDTESLDGGRTWTRLGVDPSRRSITLGGLRAATPVAGRGGRVLCGDAILPAGRGTPTGVGDIQSAVEWDGTSWRPVGLPLAAAAGTSDPRLALGVAYAPDGTARAARADRVLAAGQSTEFPGTAEAWAMDAGGVAYASIATPSRRARLMWGADGAWSDVPAPGEVRALAVDGERVWVAAGMLGRGARGQWDWTRWPRQVRIDGLTARGTTVIGWGTPTSGFARGVLVVSRDGGATLQLAPLDRIRPVWVAIDPHAPSELLVLDDAGTVSRVRMR